VGLLLFTLFHFVFEHEETKKRRIAAGVADWIS
jgi:hypothetical protein